MSWLNDTVTHRCAIPAVPRNYGAGSQWKCGDIGTDSCGLVYVAIAQDEGLVLSLMDPQPDVAVEAPSVAVRPQTAAPKGLTLG